MTNAEIVRSVTAALEQGDVFAVMANTAPDITWDVYAADTTAVTGAGTYTGRRGVAAFLGALGAVTFTSAHHTSMTSDGDTVVTTTHLVFDDPTGRRVACDEVQVWHIADGKVARVDVDIDPPVVVDAAP